MRRLGRRCWRGGCLGNLIKIPRQYQSVVADELGRALTLERNTVEASLVALSADGNGLGPFAVAVDKVDVVHLQITDFCAECSRAIIADTTGLAQVVCDGNLVAGVARRIACVSIKDQRTLEALERYLFLVCSLVDPN